MKFEGISVAPEVAGKFSALAGELGLDSAKAQKVADFFVAQQKEAYAAYEKVEKANVEAVKTKYGADLEKNIGLARKAVEKFGGESLRSALNEAGVANHPAFVELFVQLGKALSEDTVAGGVTGSPPAASGDAALKALFPNSPEMFRKGK